MAAPGAGAAFLLTYGAERYIMEMPLEKRGGCCLHNNEAGGGDPCLWRSSLRSRKGVNTLLTLTSKEVRAMPITISFVVFGFTVRIELFQTAAQKKASLKGKTATLQSDGFEKK